MVNSLSLRCECCNTERESWQVCKCAGIQATKYAGIDRLAAKQQYYTGHSSHQAGGRYEEAVYRPPFSFEVYAG